MSAAPKTKLGFVPNISVNVVITLAVLVTTSLFIYKQYMSQSNLLKLEVSGEVEKTYSISVPYYPENYFVVGDWEVRRIQPLLLSLDVTSTGGVMLLELEGSKFRGLLPETISFVDSTGTKIIDIKALKKLLPLENQIGVEYLSKYPTPATRTRTYCYDFVYYCDMANTYDGLAISNTVTFDYSSDSLENLAEENYLPVFEIYTELTQ